jgi:lysophospholipase L1-like esterase
MSLSKKLLFSLITVTLFFSAAEGLARLLFAPLDPQLHREHVEIIRTLGLQALNDTMVADPYLFWALKPGLRGKLIEGHLRDSAIRFTLSTGSLGLRGAEVPRRKTGFRILALGDSTTFGLGVDDDQTWPAILQSLLRERSRKEVEVLNAGVPGYTSFQGLRWLRSRGLSLQPDLVLATFGFNDADSWSSRSDIETARILAIHQWEEPLLHSRLYTGLKSLLSRAAPVSPSGEGGRRPRLSGPELYATLGRIQEACASRKIPLVLIIWPYAAQKEAGDGRLLLAQPVITSFGDRYHVPVVNLLPSFASSPERLFLDHVHANPAGCRVAAEALAGVCLDRIAGKGTR